MNKNGNTSHDGEDENDDFEIIDMDDDGSTGIDDLDYDDDNDDLSIEDEDDYSYEPSEDDSSEEDNEPTDLISEFLKSKGILDKNSIKYENENGEIEEVSFEDLSLEEQLEILSYNHEITEQSTEQLELGDDEKELFKYLKDNDISLEDYINYQKQSAIEEFQNNLVSSAVDEFSDDELYIHDLKQRFPNFSEEEILDELNLAKSNETAFTKKVENLKDYYKKLEEQQLEVDQQEALLKQQQEQERIQTLILDASKDVKEISVIELEDSDIQSALDVIFLEDNEGNTILNKALNDPKQLVEIAWFISKGKESISSLVDFYRNVIKKRDETQSKQSKPKATTVVKKQTKQNQKIGKTIDDIEF